MKQNYLRSIMGAIGSLAGCVKAFHLRLKQARILIWCAVVITFLFGCITGPMRQGTGSYIPNLLRKPYPRCETTIGAYMKVFKDKGFKIWSGGSSELYQSRHIVPPLMDFTSPRQFIVLSRVPNLTVVLPKRYLPYAKDECDVDEFTIFFQIYVEYMPKLEAAK